MVEFTDFDFIIGSEVAENSEYAELFTSPKRRYRTLDSGAFEGKTLSNEAMIAMGRRLEVDELVVPDVLNDGAKTIALMEDFVRQVDKGEFLIQGVVQGRTMKEWLRCYETFAKDERVDIIGITYFKEPVDVFEHVSVDFGLDMRENVRLGLMHHLIGNNLICSKPHHMLGLCDCRGLPYYCQWSWCRSIDTSFPVMTGTLARVLTWESDKPDSTVNYRYVPVRAQESLIAINTARFREMCKASPRLWSI